MPGGWTGDAQSAFTGQGLTPAQRDMQDYLRHLLNVGEILGLRMVSVHNSYMYLKVMADRQIITDPKYVALAKEIRALRLRDYSAKLGLASWMSFVGPTDTPILRPMPATYCNPNDQGAAWRARG